ncbi:Pyridoxal phosphate-dependent transferases superfamily protein isoform 1 [Artemisia annua]|uniref:Pyridoxal phosphate-dependent transferases superfamily protein isoform 1 n=1 Tax=Artemisia annua TaxID=35608 RepID=A0A2U1PMV3_ARTAN|nr:Pyridoxal phosphate-dependent transferases superfamily protein isoform 1 [Artemisia annua]
MTMNYSKSPNKTELLYDYASEFYDVHTKQLHLDTSKAHSGYTWHYLDNECAAAFSFLMRKRRLWLWEKRQNYSYNPNRPLTPQEEAYVTSYAVNAPTNRWQHKIRSGQVSLFFTESPKNSFLKCDDLESVLELCHDKGAIVCIDGMFAPPLN